MTPVFRRYLGAFTALWIAGNTTVAQSPEQRTVADAAREVIDVKALHDVVFGRLVTIDLNRVSVETAVKALVAKAGLRVTYRTPQLRAVSHTVTLHARKMTLGDALAIVLRGTPLRAEAVTTEVIALTTAAVNGDAVVQGGIRGVVTDAATKRPVVGVVVTVHGTKFTARTDEHGVFVLNGVPAGSYTLVARRLGYRANRQAVLVPEEGLVTADVTLAVAAAPLQEVVTTVTGPQRRVELGNVVSVIRADSLVKEAPITTMSQLLTSRVPGLIVSQSQGTVGGNIRLQIRGITSLSMASEPIVIVDGVRYTSRVFADGLTPDNGRESVSPLNSLNPNDIESVEVVKGPSAATLYGTDAANGVIVVTTKKGKVGPPRWSAFYTTMKDEIPNNSQREKLEEVWRGWGHGQYTNEEGEIVTYLVEDCDLEKISFKQCVQDSVTHAPGVLTQSEFTTLKPSGSWTGGASVSGGQSSFRYFFSGNYNAYTGAIGLPDTVIRMVKRLTGSAHLPDALIRPNSQSQLSLRSNITASAGSRIDVNISTQYGRDNTLSLDPIVPAFNTLARGAWCDACLLQDALRSFSRGSEETADRMVGSANAQVRVLPWLFGRGTIGLDWATRNRHEVLGRDSTRELDPLGSVYEGRTKQSAFSGDAGVTATLARGWFNLRTSAGASFARTVNDVVTASGTDLPPATSSISFAAYRYGDQNYAEAVTVGSYLEETAALNDRLFVTLAGRLDGASGFGSKISGTVYPKASISWLLSQEPFLPHVPGLNEFRLRAAWGASGKQALPTMRLPDLSYNDIAPAAGGGQYLFIYQIGNAKLKPERSSELETGMDLTFFDRRADFNLTWYNRRTADQIVSQSLPAGYGSTYRNVGLATDKGFEALITTRFLDTKLVSASVTFGHSQNKTKLVKLGSAVPYKSPYGGFVEGYPLGTIWENKLEAIVDVNGDGFVTYEDMQFSDTAMYVGQVTPKYTERVTANLGLFQERVRLSALVDHEAGATILSDYMFDCSRCRERFDTTTSLWDQGLRKVFQPFPLQGSFTRLREVTASLVIPGRLTRSLRIESSSITLSARNLALWSHYRVPDPESVPIINGLSPLSRNIPTGVPQSRTYTMRFDVSL